MSARLHAHRATSAAALSLLLFAGPAAAADFIRPTTPGNLRVTATTQTTVSLAWNPSTDNSGVFYYQVREVNSGQTRVAPQASPTCTWTGLQPARSYRFNVRAIDNAGNQSGTSNTVTANTAAAPPLATPANLRQTGATFTSIALAWDAVPAATGYDVSRNGVYAGNSAQPSAVITGLAQGTTYTFAVRATGPGGPSPQSPPLQATTPVDTTPPTVPTLAGAAISPGRVRLTWSQPIDDSGYAGVNFYVDGKPARSMLPEYPGPSSIPVAVVIHNLRAQTTYEFTARSYDGRGNLSAASAPLVISTPAGADVTPPAAPGNLRSGVPQVSTADLAWDWPADNVGVVAFEIYMDGILVAENLLDVHYPGVDAFRTVRHVPPGTTHTFTVRARDEAGNVSAASNPLVLTFAASADVTPPTPPTHFTASTWASCAFLDIAFGPGTDNVDTWNQLEYEVYEDGIFLGFYRWEVFETSFGWHTYFLRAVDRAGNTSAPSNAITADNVLDC